MVVINSEISSEEIKETIRKFIVWLEKELDINQNGDSYKYQGLCAAFELFSNKECLHPYLKECVWDYIYISRPSYIEPKRLNSVFWFQIYYWTPRLEFLKAISA